MNKTLWLVLSASLPFGNVYCADSGFGTVSGVIVSGDGRPVSGVKVYAFNPEVATAGKIIYDLSGGDGSFRVENVVPGMNMICTTKPEDFYPDTGWGINSAPGKEAPVVDVKAGESVSGVRVVIYTGRRIPGVVRDAVTGGGLGSRFVTNTALAPEYYEDEATAVDGRIPAIRRLAPPGR